MPGLTHGCLQKKSPLRGPLDITAKVLQGKNLLELKEGTPPVGAAPDTLSDECALTVIMAYKLDVEATLKMMQRESKYSRPEEETMRLIKSQFVQSDSIDVTDVQVPLTCPVRARPCL